MWWSERAPREKAEVCKKFWGLIWNNVTFITFYCQIMSSAQIKDEKIVSHLLMLFTLQKTWTWKGKKDCGNTYTVTSTEHAKNEECKYILWGITYSYWTPSIHSGSRRLIFLSYKYTQIWVVSLDLGEWLEQPQLIHHHKDGRERLSHHEYSAMPLWLCPPLLVLSLHRLSHGMNRGASGLCVQWWILVHPTTSGKSSLNTPVAPPNLLTDTHQLVYSTLP